MMKSSSGPNSIYPNKKETISKPSGLPTSARGFDYKSDLEAIVRGLSQEAPPWFEEQVSIKDQLQDVADGKSKVLVVPLDVFVEFEGSSELLNRIVRNAWRYKALFEEAGDSLMPSPSPGVVRGDSDALGVLVKQRLEQQRESVELADDEQETKDKLNSFPPELTRNYEIVLALPTKAKEQSLREVGAPQIGRLVRIKGIVTRVGEVMPRMVVACYLCSACGYEVYQPLGSQREFTPLVDCPTRRCQTNRKKNSLALRPKYSRFVKFQELRVQEMPEQVPIGNVPRSLVVEARGESTRGCTAGDVVVVEGMFLPEKAKARFFRGGAPPVSGLLSSTYLRLMNLRKDKKGYGEADEGGEFDEQIARELALGNPYERLARSVAPEIHGHLDVKKAVLLQLVGGVAKSTGDGMRIRGDINVALFGDPGVAKSQLLKHVCRVAPRAVYTTGKGSSGVGLTAAVTRDSSTGEVALEGGALVLADKGICCIDEFDKMDDSDRTAIHEVMEQQTVSIAKAGITTTLNARTAVLAAANPLYGRYNKKLSPQENINLPAALLSRFDLLFLLLDKVDRERDRSLAEHILCVHKTLAAPKPTAEDGFRPFESGFIRAFVARARRLDPVVPRDEAAAKQVVTHLVETYVAMRQEHLRDTDNDHSKSVLTPRQLLSILRLASAHARVRGSTEVSTDDVDEAVRLVRQSKASLEDDDQANATGGGEKDDFVSKIFRVCVDLLKARRHDFNPHVKYADLEERVLRMGFTAKQLQIMLDEYTKEEMQVLTMNSARTVVRLNESYDDEAKQDE